MIMVIIGLLIVVWAAWAGGGGNPANAAELFRGPAGRVLNILAIIIGISLILLGIF
jgi:hypothetical protein